VGGAAQASTLIAVASYDMPNGDGTAEGGDFNYWDAGYSNCVAANCTTDGLAGAYLSGGLGKLTDSVIPTNSFFGGDGVGAYVGWLENPTITFHLGSVQAVNEVKLYVDNSAISGVAAPGSVVIDGTSYSDPSWGSIDGPQMLDITGLALNTSVTVVLDRSTAQNIYWVFLSEAELLGPSPNATPLPAAWSMMLIGMAGYGVVAYRRRRNTAMLAVA
jgi:hypothetical protein